MATVIRDGGELLGAAGGIRDRELRGCAVKDLNRTGLAAGALGARANERRQED